MSKYINADDYAIYLLEKFKSEIGKAFNRCGEAVIEYIDSLPSADVVDIVRCKDCKKYKPYDYPYLCGECENCSYDFPAKIVKEDGYCDEGERKDNDK